VQDGATSGTREPFDPRSLNDPVALTTAWTPRVRGGTNICTHTLASRTAERQAFKPTRTAWVYYVTVVCITAIPFVTTLRDVLLSASTSFGHAGLVFLASLFLWFGVSVLYRGTEPIVFDRTLGLHWRGWRTPRRGSTRAGVVPLSRIHAIQVVSEYVPGKRSSFYSHELNLVLSDGGRVNVVDHGNKGQLTSDAKALAEFLAVPLWDPS